MNMTNEDQCLRDGNRFRDGFRAGGSLPPDPGWPGFAVLWNRQVAPGFGLCESVPDVSEQFSEVEIKYAGQSHDRPHRHRGCMWRMADESPHESGAEPAFEVVFARHVKKR